MINQSRHDCKCEPHTPQTLRDYSPLSAGQRGEVRPNHFELDLIGQFTGICRHSENTEAVGDVNIAGNASGMRNTPTTEASSLTGPPVVDGDGV